MAEWLRQENLIVCNEGNQLTFQRYDQQSTIDLTLCSEKTLAKIRNWKVSDEKTLCWQRPIFFKIQTTTTHTVVPSKKARWGWKIEQENIPTVIMKLNCMLKSEN